MIESGMAIDSAGVHNLAECSFVLSGDVVLLLQPLIC